MDSSLVRPSASLRTDRPAATHDTYCRLNAALEGAVIVSLGQVTPGEKRVLDQAVRAGKLVKWRGHWFPVAGCPQYGLGPLKTCWGTPEAFAAVNIVRSAA
jgi:hypothetical protein